MDWVLMPPLVLNIWLKDVANFIMCEYTLIIHDDRTCNVFAQCLICLKSTITCKSKMLYHCIVWQLELTLLITPEGLATRCQLWCLPKNYRQYVQFPPLFVFCFEHILFISSKGLGTSSNNLLSLSNTVYHAKPIMI